MLNSLLFFRFLSRVRDFKIVILLDCYIVFGLDEANLAWVDFLLVRGSVSKGRLSLLAG